MAGLEYGGLVFSAHFPCAAACLAFLPSFLVKLFLYLYLRRTQLLLLTPTSQGVTAALGTSFHTSLSARLRLAGERFLRAGAHPALGLEGPRPPPRPSCTVSLRCSHRHSEAILECGGRQSWGQRSRPRSDLCRKAAPDVFSILWVPVACLQSRVPVLAEKTGSLFLGCTAGHPF